MPSEHCANCGRAIGPLETPRVWEDQIVCSGCHQTIGNADNPANAAARSVQHVTYVVGANQASPGVAAILSFFIPGVGHMYLGYPVEGVLFLLGTLLGYVFCLVPGIIIHICSVVAAACAKPAK